MAQVLADSSATHCHGVLMGYPAGPPPPPIHKKPEKRLMGSRDPHPDNGKNETQEPCRSLSEVVASPSGPTPLLKVRTYSNKKTTDSFLSDETFGALRSVVTVKGNWIDLGCGVRTSSSMTC